MSESTITLWMLVLIIVSRHSTFLHEILTYINYKETCSKIRYHEDTNPHYQAWLLKKSTANIHVTMRDKAHIRDHRELFPQANRLEHIGPTILSAISAH